MRPAGEANGAVATNGIFALPDHKEAHGSIFAHVTMRAVELNFHGKQ